MMHPFTPGRTLLVDVSDVAASVALDANASAVRLVNAGDVVMFVRVGTGPQTAVADADYPVLPGTAEIITKGVGADMLSVIGGDAGPHLLYVTVGWGT